MASLKRLFARGQSRLRRSRKGVIIVLVAVLLLGILLFAGFSVDVAHMMRARTELRATVDLAAKAAAGELSRTQDLDLARGAAKAVARSNEIAGKQLTLSNEDIVFGHSTLQPDGTWSFEANANPLNSVNVNARRMDGSADGPVDLFFGSLYNRDGFETQSSATALFLDVDICLVLDRSSSMKLPVGNWDGLMSTSSEWFCRPPRTSSRWQALDDAVDLFVERLGETQAIEHIALVTFGSKYNDKCGVKNLAATIDEELDGDLTRVTDAMTTRSNSIWNGATDIEAGIELGHTVLTGANARNYSTKVMIVLTDGVYTENDPVPAAEAAANDNIIVHTITFGDGANQDDMQAVAAAGYGNHYHAPDAQTLEDVFVQIAASIAILTD